jgi:hypothetical protein
LIGAEAGAGERRREGSEMGGRKWRNWVGLGIKEGMEGEGGKMGIELWRSMDLGFWR